MRQQGDQPDARLLLIGSLAFVLADGLSIWLVDKPAASWSHDHLHGDHVFVWLTHLVDVLVPGSVLGVFLLGLAFIGGYRLGPVARGLLLASLATLLAIALKDNLKFAFGRMWPETWVNNNPSWIKDGAYGFQPFHGGAGWSSFPSGHMAVISAPFIAVAQLVRKWRFIAWLPILAVAIGLYGANYHFIGDILAGTALGWCSASIIVRLSVRPSGFAAEARPF